MFEKVNPAHPDKIADRIAGAIVDLAYEVVENPHIAVEVLIGHGVCHVIVESDFALYEREIAQIVDRIGGNQLKLDFVLVPQDKHLNANQNEKIRCGDNGIFKGVPVSHEQKSLSEIARVLYWNIANDGKYILDGEKLVICQSNATDETIRKLLPEQYQKSAIVNPLGFWTGGTNVDCGATNRKLGSDMGDSVTGGGLHGKDLSKADVSVNIYAFLKAQETGDVVNLSCAIGDECINGIPYAEIVDTARDFIKTIGGFEKFAEWGLI